MYTANVTSRWRARQESAITPHNALFIIVSFEGPDAYSQAGGLGVRVSGLSSALAAAGYETHLFFIGDPSLAGEERIAGHVEATRGCLHMCRHCPIPSVYEGRFFVVQADVVLEDIRRQVAAGARHITFGDADFLNGPGHVMEIVRRMHAEHPALTFVQPIQGLKVWCVQAIVEFCPIDRSFLFQSPYPYRWHVSSAPRHATDADAREISSIAIQCSR